MTDIKPKRFIFGPPWWAVVLNQKLDTLLKGVTHIMADQDKLDADVTALNAAEAAVADNLAALNAQIAALKAQPAAVALDFTGLDAAVASVQGLVPPTA